MTRDQRAAMRAAQAQKRRDEVERKRKEREEQIKREKEAAEREEQAKREFEEEMRRREQEKRFVFVNVTFITRMQYLRKHVMILLYYVVLNVEINTTMRYRYLVMVISPCNTTCTM